jgi:Ca-activated chloride channel family protein
MFFKTSTVFKVYETRKGAENYIAKMTGGRYFRATNEEKLAGIYREIDQLEKTRFNVLRYNQKTEEFLPFGLAAALALLIEFILNQFFIRTLL